MKILYCITIVILFTLLYGCVTDSDLVKANVDHEQYGLALSRNYTIYWKQHDIGIDNIHSEIAMLDRESARFNRERYLKFSNKESETDKGSGTGLVTAADLGGAILYGLACGTLSLLTFSDQC